ncbi:TPA: hypothetical protein N0F65_003825 [Lagenidium giganteum]|uniref:WW domain-containing protein n=1 Tax=Lagenidium giganteum TaxID=4803 RepID=A0AAV2YUZ3_9STRA|nr:TPA: hypothetical protein N0F65_003825 [Lagenidium giganteum]
MRVLGSLPQQLVRCHVRQQRHVLAAATFSTKAFNAPRPLSTAATSKFAWAETDMPPPSPGRGIMGRSANFDVTKTAETAEKWMWLFKMLGFFNEDDRLYRESTTIFTSAVNQSAHPDFYRALKLTPNFRGQQALLVAHVWMLHRRLGMEGDAGKVLQELVFDRLWEETVVRIRYQDVSELTVNKHLAEVQQACFNACISYDRGLKEGPGVFQTAVAKHLLADESVEQQRTATVMAEYMKRELKNLENVDAKYIMKGTIPWGQHPEPASNAPAFDEEYMLIGREFGNWRSALDNRGKLYFWNKHTRYSVWTLDEAKKIDAQQAAKAQQ